MTQEPLIQDNIPESGLARSVYIFSFIPILGAVLFVPLGFAALIQLGKGRTGFWLLQKGLIRTSWITALILLAVATYWFCPQWKYEQEQIYISSTPTGREYGGTGFGKGYVMRCWEWPEKFVKVGTWTFHYEDLSNKLYEQRYWYNKATGPYRFWHKNGKLRVAGNYRNGKKDGVWTFWYNNGQKLFEGQIINDKFVGEWNYWNKDGILKNTFNFSNETSSGYCTEWYPNGIPKASGPIVQHNTDDFRYRDIETFSIATFEWAYGLFLFGNIEQDSAWPYIERNLTPLLPDGKGLDIKFSKHGLWSYWYESGNKKAEENLNSYDSYKVTKWYPSGKKQEEGNKEYDRKIGNWKTWHENGQPRAEGKYSKGAYSGHWTMWHENGQLESEGNYSDGKYSGHWTWWYDDGQRWCECQYKNGVENGIWRRWQYNGVLMEEGFYVDGIKHGYWTYFYPSGVAARSGGFIDDKETGRWTYWETTGEVGFKGEFMEGREIGPWTNWYENGNKMNEGVYSMPKDTSKDDNVWGYRIGLWRTWNEDGQLVKREYFDSSGLRLATKLETTDEDK